MRESIFGASGTKNGEFFVRSAYHLAKDIAEVGKGSCSSNKPLTNIWKEVWSIKGPGVVKNFLWKAWNNILPTRENLKRHGITEDALCPICGRCMETISHILWSCESAKDV